MKKIIMYLIITMTITSTANAAEVPRESAPCNATNEAIVIVENYIGNILTEVQSGLGYADARAKSNRIFFNAWLNGQTNGYSYGELVDIANAAIWQYRDMYLRPDFYANNLEKVRLIITPVIEDYKSGKITYAEAEFNARTKIYQSVNPSFNPDLEYMKDPMSRDIPSVDNNSTFNGVIDKIEEWVKTNTKSYNNTKTNVWSCIYHRSDMNVDIKLEIMAFDLYVDESKLPQGKK